MVDEAPAYVAKQPDDAEDEEEGLESALFGPEEDLGMFAQRLHVTPYVWMQLARSGGIAYYRCCLLLPWMLHS